MKSSFMAFFKNFKGRIIVPTLAVLLAMSFCIGLYLHVRFSQYSSALIQEKVAADTNGMNRFLEDCKANSRVAAISVAQDYRVAQAIRRRDRQEIIRLLAPALEFYRVSFFTVADAKGAVIARTHDPGSFGDSAMGEHNVRGAMAGKATTCFERGDSVKVSARTGAPVRDGGGAIIGVVSAGFRFDMNEEVEEIKNLLNAEVTVFLDDKRVATTIAKHGVRVVGTMLDPAIAEMVVGSKEDYYSDTVIFGDAYKACYKPLLNGEGDAFATIVFAVPLANMKAAASSLLKEGVLVGIAGLCISMAALFFVISSISRPITKLSQDTGHIAAGHLGLNVHEQGEGEVGSLGKSLQEVVLTIRKLIEDVNTMIYEHGHGNTDHCIDTDPFEGDYKILAANIIELAAMGIKDPLTGLSNRRSFDNRLDIEWIRGIREKSPTSVLLVDLDNFRRYNDTYGHHQGDMALKAAARGIARSLMRDIDFAARWGSDKFIVLMPATDAKGALGVAERIRTEIENAPIPRSPAGGTHHGHLGQDHPGHHGHQAYKEATGEETLTACIGVASQTPMKDASVDDLLISADEALMKAKEAGKNRVALKNEKTVAIF